MARKSKRQQQHPGSDREAALACIPLKNPEATQEPRDDGLLLSYPVEVKPWFRTLFKGLSGRSNAVITRRLELDALGASVWLLVDGRRTVADIVTLFRTPHQLSQREAELSVTGFLRELGRRGLIAMQGDQKGAD